MNCPAGFYCPSGTSDTQNKCSQGYYCPANSRYPTPCPKGNYCPEGASAPTQCDAGFYCPDLAFQRTPCTPGFYCPVGSSAQLLCSGNTFSAAQASVCSCISPPHGSATSTATDCILTCDPGFAPYMGQCIASMKPAQLTYLNVDGTTSMTRTDYISYVCPPCYSIQGSLCSFDGTCNPKCSNGYIINQDSVCVQCPPGKQSRNNVCVDADAGFYASLGVEMACPPGTYSSVVGATNASTCALCPMGTSSSVIGATSASTCMPCAAGTYSDSLGATYCTSCAAGTFSTSIGRTTACTSQCRTCSPASKQYTSEACHAWADTVCATCSDPAPSQYVTGVCTTAADTQLGTKATSSPGSYFTVMPVSGSYTTVGVRGTSGNCTAGQTYCPDGISAYTCAVPAVNQWASTPCTVTSNTLISLCTTTPPNSNSYLSNACTSSTDTQFKTYKLCNAGYYGTNASPGSSYNVLGNEGSCSLCDSGTYSNVAVLANIGKSICLQCSSGTYSNVSSNDMSRCQPCPQGTYSGVVGASLCTKCAAQTASNVYGATSSSTCVACPGGLNAREGAAYCDIPDITYYYFIVSTLPYQQLNKPRYMAYDSAGNMYISQFNNIIVQITSTGGVSTIAGLAGSAAFADATRGTNARFSNPQGIAVGPDGNLYVADYLNKRIRKIVPSGYFPVTTFAGSGTFGTADGSAATAKFSYPKDIAFDSAGNMYVADNTSIRKITPDGTVSTFVGGLGTINGLTVDKRDGTIYVAANGNIRKITPGGVVSTFVTINGNVMGLRIDPRRNALYATNYSGQYIERISLEGRIDELAGDGTAGYQNGVDIWTKFTNPYSIAVDNNGNLAVTEINSNLIRKITITVDANQTVTPIN